jgi:hypothetical protein
MSSSEGAKPRTVSVDMEIPPFLIGLIVSQRKSHVNVGPFLHPRIWLVELCPIRTAMRDSGLILEAGNLGAVRRT